MRLTASLIIRTLVAAASLTLFSNPALSYNDTGHLQSTRLIVQQSLAGAPFNPSEKKIIAACAQLPDMSDELDAAKTYLTALNKSKWDWAMWGTRNHLGNGELQRMFAVQQLQHALTGGNPIAIRNIALASLREFVNKAMKTRGTDHVTALCALGMGFHFWGDALAHTQVTWNGDTDEIVQSSHLKMYPTGRGHGLSEGHFPDDVLCSYYTKTPGTGNTSCNQDWQDTPHRRFALWVDYWSGTGSLLQDQARPLSLIFEPISPAVPYSKKEKDDFIALIKAQGNKTGFESVSPDDNDPKMGGAIRDFILRHFKDENDLLDDAGDAHALAFYKELDSVNNLGPWDHEKSCSAVLELILNVNKISDLLENGARKPTCGEIWNWYYQVMIGNFRNSIQACSGNKQYNDCLPVDRDWLEIYQTPSGQTAPIECYANLVSKGLTSPNGDTCPFEN